MSKLSDYSKPAKADFSLEERLAFGCMLIETIREMYGRTPAAERHIDKIKLKMAKELSEERVQYGLTADEQILFYSMMHA